MEKDEKFNINLAPGQERVEITMLNGEAPLRLNQKAPIKTNIKGTLGAVKEYLSKRVDAGQFKQEDCHILVDRDKMSIKLVFNEKDAYNQGEVEGSLQFYSKFDEFGINNMNREWTPQELGMFFKMNRTFFPDKQENMRLVSELMNFKATVNNQIERRIKENGDRTDDFSQVVNSNLPSSFRIKLPVLKGCQPEEFNVETFARISGREVSFILISPDAAALIEDIKASAIDEQLKSIAEIAPDIAIIEV